MNDEPSQTSTAVCPMCGATTDAIDTKCPSCGEVLPATTATDAGPNGNPSEEELSTFVGRGSHYYLGKWQGLLEGRNNGAGFNLAAFLFSGIWIPYRKMYGIALIYYGAILVESIAEDIIFVLILGRDVPPAFELATGLIASAICGAFGNRWYLRLARRQIESLRAEGHGKSEFLRRLSRRGGTSFLAGFGLVLAFIAISMAIAIVTQIILGGE